MCGRLCARGVRIIDVWEVMCKGRPNHRCVGGYVRGASESYMCGRLCARGDRIIDVREVMCEGRQNHRCAGGYVRGATES